MSATAPRAETATASEPVLDAALAGAGSSSELELQAQEQKRWLLWASLPALASALFVALTFATGHGILLAPAIVFMVADIFVLVWLAMSSDTNG